MQYVHFYVCFHVYQQGDRGKALALEKSIDATKEVPTKNEIFLLACAQQRVIMPLSLPILLAH